MRPIKLHPAELNIPGCVGFKNNNLKKQKQKNPHPNHFAEYKIFFSYIFFLVDCEENLKSVLAT